LPESHAASLAEHFDDVEQQHDAASFGMWIFLATEVMFFGGLFAGYTIFRNLYLPAFEAGSRHLNVTIGAMNTALLICSSLTMALAVHAAQLGKRKSLMAYLVSTMALGMTFVLIKILVEWRGDFHEHLVPGINFAYSGPHAKQVELFFFSYFAMTGVHALHMIVGVGIMTVLLLKAWRGRFSSEYYTPVEMAGLYWHFVDIIWIFLFPLLYLVGGRY
jgi:cytochrome c oxidase subunit 3